MKPLAHLLSQDLVESQQTTVKSLIMIGIHPKEQRLEWLSSNFDRHFKEKLVKLFCCPRYECKDSAKKVVDTEQENAPLLEQLNVTCLYNGQWEFDITTYQCTGLLRFVV